MDRRDELFKRRPQPITDLINGADKFTVYRVYAMTQTSSLKFSFMIPADRFAKVKPVVDGIPASCKSG